MSKTVTVIPQRKKMYTPSFEQETKKRRVAAYARVSTESDEQLTSYEAQVDHYTTPLKSEEDR